MSVQRWVFSSVDYLAHLLRHGAQPVRARCGQQMRLQGAAIEHPTAPNRACPVCAQLHRLDLLGQAIEGIMAAPTGQPPFLSDEQRDALRDWLEGAVDRARPDDDDRARPDDREDPGRPPVERELPVRWAAPSGKLPAAGRPQASTMIGGTGSASTHLRRASQLRVEMAQAAPDRGREPAAGRQGSEPVFP